MKPFTIQAEAIDTGAALRALCDPRCGGLATFEGWVRDHQDGRAVERLEYEAYAPLALREGAAIVEESLARFDIRRAACVHRTGALAIGDVAVWVGVSAPHRAAAFEACRYIIDEVKHRVPIWKKEYFADGTAEWVNCAHCATAAAARR